MLKYRNLLLGVPEILFAALFDQSFQDIGIETNGGDTEIFSMLFDYIVKDKQVSPIPEKE